jgi:perosamine synthetase
MILQIEPWIDKNEKKYLDRVVESTFVTEHELTKEFENRIKKLTGSKHAIAITNGTAAIYCCLLSLGIGPGDEVIVPNLTFVATANAVIMTGATPVLCDISSVSMCIELEQIKKVVTDKTKCIIPVHLFGNASQMNEIIDYAKENKIKIVEDAAQGVGVKIGNKHVGTFGDLGILSFYGNKTITCGEGGIILTEDDSLAKRCYQLKNHGRSRKGVFVHETIGFNFSFTEMQAAIGLSQLDKLDQIVSIKERIYNRYCNAFTNADICIPERVKNVTSVMWMSFFFFKNRRGLEEHMTSKGIQTRKFFYPLHLQPCYKDFPSIVKDSCYDVSISLFENGLCLPSSVLMTDEDQDTVIAEVLNFTESQ